MSTKSANVVDDWEGIDDTELDTKVDQLKKSHATINSAKANTEVDCSRPFSAMLLNDDDCLGTQYVSREPTVKILKRPTNDKNNQQLLAEQKPKAPIKTLQQREQEYAEARLRILGSAKSAEDEEETSIVINKNGTSNSNTTNGYSTKTQLNYPNPVGNSSRQYPRNNNFSPQQNYATPSHPQQLHNAFQIPPEMRRIDDNVIRLPRGPDGSTGFFLKR